MPNDILLTMAVMGDQDAREERLIREIMSVDDVAWDQAQTTFQKMVKENRQGLFVSTLPYKTGIFCAMIAGFASIPMIFDINTVMWFNEIYVTSDVPEAKDLETPLEVGSWAELDGAAPGPNLLFPALHAVCPCSAREPGCQALHGHVFAAPC